MPAGIARSPFVSPLAKSLGWSLGRLRALFNRKGYNSPYMNEVRGLKICLEAGLNIKPYLDKAGHGPEFLAAVKGTKPPPATVSSNELVLSQPPAPPPPTTQLPTPVAGGGQEKLIVRLAKMMGAPTTENQKKAKAILAKHGMDARSYKSEDRILQAFVTEGYSIEGFERRFDRDQSIVATRHDIDRMPLADLRVYAADLQRELASKVLTIRNMETRNARIKGLLESARHTMIAETRAMKRDDQSEAESLLYLARSEAGREV